MLSSKAKCEEGEREGRPSRGRYNRKHWLARGCVGESLSVQGSCLARLLSVMRLLEAFFFTT